jgi:hypothetical protein
MYTLTVYVQFSSQFQEMYSLCTTTTESQLALSPIAITYTLLSASLLTHEKAWTDKCMMLFDGGVVVTKMFPRHLVANLLLQL